MSGGSPCHQEAELQRSPMSHTSSSESGRRARLAVLAVRDVSQDMGSRTGCGASAVGSSSNWNHTSSTCCPWQVHEEKRALRTRVKSSLRVCGGLTFGADLRLETPVTLAGLPCSWWLQPGSAPPAQPRTSVRARCPRSASATTPVATSPHTPVSTSPPRTPSCSVNAPWISPPAA